MTTQFPLVKFWRRLKLMPHLRKPKPVVNPPAPPAKNSKHPTGRKIPFLDLP